ncbi:hypothetical protein BJ165DRAFT_1530074 [Panaeolus papilionaceus]|nr:hypothetical protein BJ165DRAFT_1530074 [Panaeolus papilionaceus]
MAVQIDNYPRLKAQLINIAERLEAIYVKHQHLDKTYQFQSILPETAFYLIELRNAITELEAQVTHHEAPLQFERIYGLYNPQVKL